MSTSTKKDTLKYISKKDFVGTLAKWAIRQSPHSCPDNLERVVIKADGAWPVTGDSFKDQTSTKEWVKDDFEDFVHSFVYSTPEVISWNTPNSGRQGHSFISAFEPIHRQSPDDDFIDLDALIRNIVNDCWNQE
jgi:hypothetical protein